VKFRVIKRQGDEADYERLAPRRLKNFSKNRPERTNLNHQYAIRRVFIVASSSEGRVPPAIAPKTANGCDLLHI
jgi:hypothetical protein